MRSGLGAAGIGVLAVVCCAGLPLLAAAGLSASAYALIGGSVAAVVALAAGAVFVALRAHRRATCRPLVEILYFAGCPNHERATALVERVSRELGVRPMIRLVDVPDAETAAHLRFLGSPTVRVDGRDVEPGAEARTDFVLSCRVFRTEQGFAGQPEERWVREALLRE